MSRFHPQRVQLLMRPVTPARCLTLESQRGQFVNVSICPPMPENLPVTDRLSPVQYYPTLNRLNAHKQPVETALRARRSTLRAPSSLIATTGVPGDVTGDTHMSSQWSDGRH